MAENISGFITGVSSVIGSVALMLHLDKRMTLAMLAALPFLRP